MAYVKAKPVLVSGIFVLAASSVSAVQILGEEYPLLILLPIPIIVLMMLIFAVLLIRDLFRKRSPKKPELRPLAGAPPKRWHGFRTLFRKPSGSIPELRHLESYEHALEIIDELEQDLAYTDSYTVFERLIQTIRRFFADYLNINYEFTYEELEQELAKNNKDIIFFSKNLSKLQYSQDGYSKNELRGLIGEFRSIIMKLADRKRSQLKGIFKSEADHHEKVKKIDDLLAKGRQTLQDNPREAVGVYRDIYTAYQNLASSEKQIVGQRIRAFYSDLQQHLKG
ncbi:MAG TPA: hypothetical protein VJB08_05650 [Candidatus Nanoarchaeia archaeon]|nr:hypothetical protein [Candidatus Nanoarchaeia archaeon]